ncbi:MAG: CPBP family intramembrane glutamic endopeptidase [Chloroflexota bacterium]|mgnify:CR=1 FL=1
MSQTDRAIARFFALTFALSLPLWLVGGRRLPLPVNLPASALVAFVPAIAASALVFREAGARGAATFLRRALDFRRIRGRRPVLLALLLAPVLYGLSYAVMRLFRLPLPERVVVSLQTGLPLFLTFMLTATGEELGWTGYATERMLKRSGTLRSGLLLGIVWAVWHAVPFIQTGNSATWVFWQSVKTVGMRVLLVWLYRHSGGSVLAVELYHAADNLGWALFPNFGSHYNPLVTGALTWLAALALMLRRPKASGYLATPPAPDTTSPK